MLNSETRIAACIGTGTGQLPCHAWWRTGPAQFASGNPGHDEPAT